MTPIPPLERTIVVAWTPEAAFRRFTADLGTWWPTATHSVGGKQVRRVVFEEGVGGRIYEEHLDGRRFLWGTVLEWEPPRSVRFTWHPARDPDPAQQVTVRFTAEDSGTRLVLTHIGWESFGADATRFRRGYSLGWRYVLDTWAGRRTFTIWALDLVAALMTGWQRLKRGRVDPRETAKGELTAP